MKPKNITAAYLSVFCMELSLIIRAGMPIADGLLMLKDDDPNKASQDIIYQVYLIAESGQPLSAALTAVNAFPQYMIKMVLLAEQTGRLESTLSALSTYYQRQERLSVSIRNAVLYPSILLVLMVIVVLVLTTKVLPVFNYVFIQMGTNMSPFAARVMDWGNNLAIGAVIVISIVVVLIFAAEIIKHFPKLKSKIFNFFKKHFGGRGVNGRIATARFASAMAMAGASGMNIEDALTSVSAICGGSKEIDKKILDCHAYIATGNKASQALAQSGLFSRRDCRMLLLAEQTGTMAGIMEEIALRNQQKIEDEIDAIIGYIEPALVLLTSIIVGIVLLSVMLPLISIMSSLG